MALINEYYPEEVLHPCETLNEKLNEMGMSRKEFALRTGKPEKTIIAVLKGESSLTPEMAVIFENITKIPARFWINKQARYNEFKARQKRGHDVEKAEAWTRSFPYAQMVQNGWVTPTHDIKQKTINLLEYFAVSNHKAWESLYLKSDLKVAAYTSLKHTHDPHAISAWLRKGELQAAAIDAPEYNKKFFLQQLETIKILMADQPDHFFPELQKLCLHAGVKVFYTPSLNKAPISGSTRWINNSPVIQLTARYKQNDRFWFTFYHEAGHIVLHGKKYISLENIDFSGADPVKEEEAHAFAEEWLLNEKQEEIIRDNLPLRNAEIITFARKFHTHPAMIIGRLQHKGLMSYSQGHEFFVPVDLAAHSG